MCSSFEKCILVTWPVFSTLYSKTGADESLPQDEITAKHGQRSSHQDSQTPPIAVA